MGGTDATIVSCEHGGNRIPAQFRALFAGAQELLQSHRGHDAGALQLARTLAAALSAPLVANTTSRLLIDLNRSPGHPALYSELTRTAPREIRAAIHSRYYLPYRERVEHLVAAALARGQRVVHFSCHSFTPVLDGETREADVGFLYDPRCAAEVELCRRAMAALRARSRHWRARRNYPYAGRSDGLCTWLRRTHAGAPYLGVEIELNQRHLDRAGTIWSAFCADVVAALVQALAQAPVSEEATTAMTASLSRREGA